MKIHQTTLEVLEENGVRFEEDQVFELLMEQACRMYPETKTVKILGRLVEDCTKKCHLKSCCRPGILKIKSCQTQPVYVDTRTAILT